MTIAPWVYGVGVVGLGAVGVVAYEILKRPAASNGGLITFAPGANAPIIPGAAPPIVDVIRPPPPGSQTFSQVQPPGGPEVTISPGMLASVQVPQNQSLTLVLPPGGKWVKVIYGNANSNPQTIQAQINLAGDQLAPIAISGAQLLGGTAVGIEWIDRNAASQVTGVPYTIQKVVTVRLHP